MVSPTDGRLQRGAATRVEILDAAEREVATRGFSQTSIRSVARAIGMSAPGVARHFPTREALFEGIMLRMREKSLFLENADLRDGASVFERFSRMVARLKSKQNETILYTLLLGEARLPSHPAHDDLRHLMEGVVARLHEAVGDDALMIHAGWQGLRLLWLYLPDRVDPLASVQRRIALVDTSCDGGSVASPPVVTTTRRARGTLPSSDAPDLRMRILLEAGRAFGELGYQATSLRSIATAIGISHSTLIYHFANKQDLLRGVLGRGERVGTRGSQDGDEVDYLRAVYELKFDNTGRDDLARARTTLAFEAIDPAHPAHEPFVERFERVLGRLERVLTGLGRSGRLEPGIDPRLEAVWFLAVWEGLRIQSFYLDDSGDPEIIRSEINRYLVGSEKLARFTTES